MLTINLLQALPKTPLWDRLKRDRPPDRRRRAAKATWCSCARTTRWWRCGGAAIAYANDPERLFARFCHQVDATYVNRLVPPARGKLTLGQSARRRRAGLATCCVHVGLKSDYRRPFWRAARHALRRGQIDARARHGLHGHHLIQFTREALRGDQNASFYSTRQRERAAA